MKDTNPKTNPTKSNRFLNAVSQDRWANSVKPLSSASECVNLRKLLKAKYEPSVNPDEPFKACPFFRLFLWTSKEIDILAWTPSNKPYLNRSVKSA